MDLTGEKTKQILIRKLQINVKFLLWLNNAKTEIQHYENRQYIRFTLTRRHLYNLKEDRGRRVEENSMNNQGAQLRRWKISRDLNKSGEKLCG